ADDLDNIIRKPPLPSSECQVTQCINVTGFNDTSRYIASLCQQPPDNSGVIKLCTLTKIEKRRSGEVQLYKLAERTVRNTRISFGKVQNRCVRHDIPHRKRNDGLGSRYFNCARENLCRSVEIL